MCRSSVWREKHCNGWLQFPGLVYMIYYGSSATQELILRTTRNSFHWAQLTIISLSMTLQELSVFLFDQNLRFGGHKTVAWKNTLYFCNCKIHWKLRNESIDHVQRNWLFIPEFILNKVMLVKSRTLFTLADKMWSARFNRSENCSTW